MKMNSVMKVNSFGIAEILISGNLILGRSVNKIIKRSKFQSRHT